MDDSVTNLSVMFPQDWGLGGRSPSSKRPDIFRIGRHRALGMMMGGVIVPYEALAKLRREHTRLAESLKGSLERILETGCVIKDLDVGLLDFPSIIDNEEVYLCWKLGEDRIRYYHRQDEGFAGRKPIDPRDPGPGDTVQ